MPSQENQSILKHVGAVSLYGFHSAGAQLDSLSVPLTALLGDVGIRRMSGWVGGWVVEGEGGGGGSQGVGTACLCDLRLRHGKRNWSWGDVAFSS